MKLNNAPENLQDELAREYNEQMLFADGFEAALIGVAQQFNKHCACYDYEKCIEILVTRDGMSHEEAVEYFEFNVTGAYCGEFTPVFLRKPEQLEQESKP